MGLLTLILIPLIAGYAFNSSFFISRYVSVREEGYRLYFRAALYGVALLIISALIYMLLATSGGDVLGNGSYLPLSGVSIFTDLQNSSTYAEVQYAAFKILAITLLLGVALGHVLNSITNAAYWLEDRLPFFVWGVSHLLRLKWYYLKFVIRNDDFEKLILRAMSLDLPVSFTMTNGKVYIGYVIRAIDPGEGERTHVRILPVKSGRRRENGTLEITTDYYQFYKDLIEERIEERIEREDKDDLYLGVAGNYEIVLPAREIHSSNLFIQEAYNQFQAHYEKQK